MIRDAKEKGKLRLKLAPPPSSASPLFTAAHRDPKSIDELLIPNLLNPSLPSALAWMIDGVVTQNVTPPLYWGGDPCVSRNDYINCLVHATMIGRAFSLLSTSAPAPAGKTEDEVVSAACLLPTELKLEIYAQYQLYQQQRRRFWQHGLTPVFIKALMSGDDPAPAARFAAAILFFTCWTCIQAAQPPVKGTGTEYAKIDEGCDGVPEYVPLECFEMLDAARKHVAEGGTGWPPRDCTSAEVVTMALAVLEDAGQMAGNHAEINWSDYLGSAFSEWQAETKSDWVVEKKAKPGSKGKKKGV